VNRELGKRKSEVWNLKDSKGLTGSVWEEWLAPLLCTSIRREPAGHSSQHVILPLSSDSLLPHRH
jgi:hypothetical protein